MKSVAKQTTWLYLEATFARRKLFVLSLFLLVASVGISTVIPFLASRTLAAALNHDAKFWIYMMWVGSAVVISLICNRIGFLALMKLIATTMYDLSNRTFACLIHRGTKFHTDNIGGKLVSDASDFTGAYNQFMNAIFTSGGPLFLSLVIGLVILFSQVWQLGVYILVIVGITLTWAYRESRTRRELRSHRLKATKALISHLSDSVVNAVTVKTFAAEAREIHTNSGLARTLRDLRIHNWQRAGSSGNNRMAFLLVSLVGLLLVIRLSVNLHTGVTGLGASIFAFSYTFGLIMRLFDINNLTRQVEELYLQAAPMTSILLEENEVRDIDGAETLEVTNGAIDFKNVSFAYTDASSGQRVFRKLNLHIKSGEHVGLVGPSGGGKTTLTRLLLRFEDIQDGEITIDGQNIQHITQVSLRDAVGYVPQEPLLFHRTVHENIAYGKPTASNQAVKKAATLAYADEFIEKLPKQYETVVGERGVKLSGGQRQRVAIARAILKNAPILVLDEATSALDSESEGLIQDAMFTLMKGKTAVVIAHRLSTIQKMDRIIVLNEGQIVEEGSHADLLKKKNGLYAKLWHHQSGGFLEEV